MDEFDESLAKALVNYISIDDIFSREGVIHDIEPIISLVEKAFSQESRTILYKILLRLFQNERNLAATMDSRLLEAVLTQLMVRDSAELLTLTKCLIACGLTPALSRWFFQQLLKAGNTSPLYEIAAHAIDHTLPPHYLFDTSGTGYASIEFPILPRTFPPAQGGYSFFSWIHLHRVHKDMHVTLFGVFDPTQKSFTMAYLEKGSNCLILQTSLKTSVRFKYTFKVGQWYNIAFIHRRPRATASSRATLFVDAEAVETLKIAYPASCPSSSSMQAFVGTLKDFVSPGAASVAYSLGQTILVGQVLLPELVQQYYKLGPDYSGNYQDYLASYMTYKASSEVKLLFEKPGITELSLKNSENMPESLLILSLSGDMMSTTSSSLAISRDARAYLSGLLKAGVSSIVLNKAVPDISSALAQGTAVGHIGGGLTNIRPDSFVSNVYKIGGVGTFLYIIEASQTKEQVVQNVSICLKAVSNSYINSEDFEKTHAYEMLARILKEKAPEFICDELLGIFLGFIGIDDEFLINPMGYRYLLADFALWSRASASVQRSHLNQFLIFSNSAPYGNFNNARLARMHIIKKFLSVLRYGVSVAMLPHYMVTLKGLLTNNFSTDAIRSVSSFIIHMLHKNGPRRRLSIKIGGPDAQNLSVPDSRQSVGLAVLIMIEEILCEPGPAAKNFLDKFAYTITNRWSLLLLSHTHTRPTAMRILARLLVVQGRSYVSKFGGKNDGFLICEALLNKASEDLWLSMFAILFGRDVAEFSNKADQLDLTTLKEAGPGDTRLDIVNPEIFPVILAILRKKTFEIADMDSLAQEEIRSDHGDVKNHVRSASLDAVMGESLRRSVWTPERLLTSASALRSVIKFMVEAHTLSKSFREYCKAGNVAVDLITTLFFLMCNADHVAPEAELNSKDSILSFDQDVTLIEGKAISGILKLRGPHSRSEEHRDRREAPSLHRGTSYILLDTSAPSRLEDVNGKAEHNRINNKAQTRQFSVVGSLLEDLLELLITITIEGIIGEGDLVVPTIKCLPPAFIEHQTFFWSLYLKAVLAKLSDILATDPNQLTAVGTVNNLAKFAQLLYCGVEDGSFLAGQVLLFDLLASILECLLRPDIETKKIANCCDISITTMRQTLQRLTLLRLSDLERSGTAHDPEHLSKSSEVLNHLLYYQQVIFHTELDDAFLRLLLYNLYALTSTSNMLAVKVLVLDVWRVVVLSQPSQLFKLLLEAKKSEVKNSATQWEEILASDSETFLRWIDSHRSDLDSFFIDELENCWTNYVRTENKDGADRAIERVRKRREKLKSQISRNQRRAETISRYELSCSSWYDNVVKVENNRNHKALQDLADNQNYIAGQWATLKMELTGPAALYHHQEPLRWRLDPTECALRQRKKLRPTMDKVIVQGRGKHPSDVDSLPAADPDREMVSTPEQEYELIEPPGDSASRRDDEQDEDRNRKVLRSLDVDDYVMEVFNVSRISGLNAIEGLLILGRLKLYLIDNYFNRSDGEICDVWDQTVQSQRDPILQVLAGQETTSSASTTTSGAVKMSHECRSFSYDMVHSASKRQFLFRDVAIELFFSDGRNYLITTLNKERDTLHRKLLEHTKLVATDELSRKDTVGAIGSFGSKLLNVFVNSPAAQAAARWEKREISNFEYLMIVNSLAGRSYNDLTQYPIMPWVLADYTSQTLDLDNPATFRDLSKNMGSQTLERQRHFQERFESFAAAGIDETKPFHFGTHYSSAMIVCSYLIRLVPFVESYLLLQGGHFDHPDRLFYSVEKAWLSASKENMTDVRELTPEWFFLPEFLSNDNGFDFGTRQVTGEKINDVQLPPWACGSPHIFIEKHREALESDFVSEHLHQWIDLTFGLKQLGLPAIESTNVYHALSYHGAIDLDTVIDPVDRLATIGIIHNFGQTPRQVFTKPHVSRNRKYRSNQLDIELTRLSLQTGGSDIKRPVGEILLQEGLVGLPLGRVLLSTNSSMSVFVSWSLSDNSIRMKSPEGLSMGIFPSLHTQTITHCLSIPNALVLGSSDTTLSVLKLFVTKGNQIALQSQTYLRGHTSEISAMTVSKTYSIIVSGEQKGSVIIFDLNRVEFVRTLCDLCSPVKAITVNDSTGEILACSGRDLKLFSVNGYLLAEASISEDMGDIVSASSLSDDIFFVGHEAGSATVWIRRLETSTSVTRKPSWSLQVLKTLVHPGESSITCFKFAPSRLYTGDSRGRISVWGY